MQKHMWSLHYRMSCGAAEWCVKAVTSNFKLRLIYDHFFCICYKCQGII
jgi:hypothetical protein